MSTKKALYNLSKEETEELPPNVLRMSDAKEIASDKEYLLKDVYFPDEHGNTCFTVAITHLHPGKQTRGHSHQDENELMEVKGGEGLILLNGHSVFIKAGMFCLVPKTVHHKVINISTSTDLVFVNYFPSALYRKGRTG